MSVTADLRGEMMGPVAQPEDPEDFIAPAAHRVRAGSLLLANTDLLEPTFRRSVIYVVEHNGGGTLGVVTVLYALAIGPLTQLFLPLVSVRRAARPT